MRLWIFKIYSVIFLLLAVGSLQLGEPHPRTFIDYLDIPITFFALTGFVAYAFEFPIGKPAFWKRYVYVVIAWDFIYNVILCYGFHLGQTWNAEPITIPLLLMNYLLFAPEYYALYLFGQMDETSIGGEANDERRPEEDSN